MLSLQEINSIFYKALMGALGYAPDSWDSSMKPPVRQMYSTEGLRIGILPMMCCFSMPPTCLIPI